MKITKNLFLGVLLSVGIAMPALASESQSGLQDRLPDASLVFESNNGKPIQFAELSSQEMKETSGARHVQYHTHWHSHYGPPPAYYRSNHIHRHVINGHHGQG